ncbi:hypothetical protein ElyMa_006063300 [Elysia marginata]|uniref:Uncharacterized protein n=1 Tax=Elysia marginata TaxID=1093978 RepID=A0AAV4GP20_9GAST|nr:hypothetical protein ElyMa_006063300 [Elysia marginata]
MDSVTGSGPDWRTPGRFSYHAPQVQTVPHYRAQPHGPPPVPIQSVPVTVEPNGLNHFGLSVSLTCPEGIREIFKNTIKLAYQ